MAVSTVSDSSTPSTSKAEPEGFEMERDSESPLGNLDYLIEEGRPLKSEGSLDHMHSIEIESDWPVSKSKLSHETLEGIHCDRPDESETKPAEDGESGIHRFEKTLDSALRSALQINSKYKVPVPARDMNESGNESGNESQLTQSHPSSTKIQSCTSSNFRGTSLPLALNAVPDSIQVTREPRYLDETEEIQRITGSLQCRIEDWKGHKLEDFGKLLLCEVLKVSQPHLTYEKRWCEVYLFERVLLCCCPKRFQPTYYSLAPSEHFPKLQLRGQVFMKTIKWVSPIPNREDRDLRVVWRSDERVEFLDLDFQDLGTRSMWEVYLEQRTVATEGDETEGEHSTELPSLL